MAYICLYYSINVLHRCTLGTSLPRVVRGNIQLDSLLVPNGDQQPRHTGFLFQVYPVSFGLAIPQPIKLFITISRSRLGISDKRLLQSSADILLSAVFAVLSRVDFV